MRWLCPAQRVGLGWAANYILSSLFDSDYCLHPGDPRPVADDLQYCTRWSSARSFKKLTETSRVPKSATILVGLPQFVRAGIFLASIASFHTSAFWPIWILLALASLEIAER